MRITASPDVERVKTEELARYTSIFLTQVVEALNNNLSFVDNFNAKTLTVSFTAANTDVAIIHGLGRVPQGYIQVGQNAATSVYDGASANTAQLLYLRASATANVRLVVY